MKKPLLIVPAAILGLVSFATAGVRVGIREQPAPGASVSQISDTRLGPDGHPLAQPVANPEVRIEIASDQVLRSCCESPGPDRQRQSDKFGGAPDQLYPAGHHDAGCRRARGLQRGHLQSQCDNPVRRPADRQAAQRKAALRSNRTWHHRQLRLQHPDAAYPALQVRRHFGQRSARFHDCQNESARANRPERVTKANREG